MELPKAVVKEADELDPTLRDKRQQKVLVVKMLADILLDLQKIKNKLGING